MASPDLVIGYHKLDTEFFTDHVQHTTLRSDASRGRRRMKVVKKWYRDRELGRGSLGTVFLERSEREECRAVKEIAKDKNSRKKIDYRRELMAMAILAKHDDLFVQLFGWYESDNYIYIAMEYIRHGHLRNYLEVERSESEAKVITRQLLEGLVVIHQEGFPHRDLKPENIFVVSASPVWVKIGDFGLAKLAKNGAAFRTLAFSVGYSAPEMGIRTGGDSSEYSNAVDIWAVGCIAHEILTRVLPFRNFSELSLYCNSPEFPRNYMLLKNISREGMEIVESMLALHPERRVVAKAALDSEWLRLEDEGQEGWETEEDSAGPALPEVPAPSGAGAANGDSPPGSSKEGFHSRVAIPEDVKDQRTTEALLLELKCRLQAGLLSKDPIDEEMSELAKHFDMLESLGHIVGETVRVGEQADAAVLMQATKITEVLGAILELPSVPRDEEYQFRKRSTDLLQKWNELIGLSDKNLALTSTPPAVKKEGGSQNGSISAQVPSAPPAGEREKKDQSGFISAHTNLKDAEENPGMAVMFPPQTESLAVNRPSTHPRTSVDGQAGEASVSRFPDALSSPKPHTNIDPDIKRLLERVLEKIQESTDSPQKPMLNNKDAVHMLLSGVISVDIRDSAGNTPLHIAANQFSYFYREDRTISEVRGALHALVASGADINAKNSARETPLFLAVSQGSYAVTGKLLDLGADAEEQHPVPLLHLAARCKSDTICQLLLRRGANVNTRDSFGRTPLHKAVANKNLIVAGSLISAGADVGARDDSQRTALSFAVVGNSVPLVKLLLDHGATPDVVDKRGNSPRQEAVRANVPAMMALVDRVPVTR